MKCLVVYLSILLSFLVSCQNHQQAGTNKTKTMTDNISFQSGYAEVNGLKMYYELHRRQGDHLVLIHGGGSTIDTSFGKVLPMPDAAESPASGSGIIELTTTTINNFSEIMNFFQR